MFCKQGSCVQVSVGSDEADRGDLGRGEKGNSVCWLELLTQCKAGVLWLLFGVFGDTPWNPWCWSVPGEACV